MWLSTPFLARSEQTAVQWYNVSTEFEHVCAKVILHCDLTAHSKRPLQECFAKVMAEITMAFHVIWKYSGDEKISID